jgi:hypothetical protein
LALIPSFYLFSLSCQEFASSKGSLVDLICSPSFSLLSVIAKGYGLLTLKIGELGKWTDVDLRFSGFVPFLPYCSQSFCYISFLISPDAVLPQGGIVSMDVCEQRGVVAACCSDSTVRIWDHTSLISKPNHRTVPRPRIVRGFDDQPLAIAIHPDGFKLLIGTYSFLHSSSFFSSVSRFSIIPFSLFCPSLPLGIVFQVFLVTSVTTTCW